MTKITITNAYSWYNKGDAGILLATIDTLKRIYKEPEFIILSFTPEEDKKRYCKDKTVMNVYSNILNPHPYRHTKIGKIIAILKLGIQMIKSEISFIFPAIRKNNKVFNALMSSDIIVVCGGGFLGGKKFDSLQHLYQIYLNTRFKKPVYIIGTSIEPITSKLLKAITEKVLKKVSFIFARELITSKYLSSFLPNDRYCLIPDMAFMLENNNDYNFKFITDLRNNNYIFGITVRSWNFPNSKKPNDSMTNYVKAIANTLDYYIEEKNAVFVFVPQVIIDYGNDSEIAKKIQVMMKPSNREKFIIREDDWSPYEIKSLISYFDGFIGTRMHSNIFATSMGVPTIAIAYEKKTNGIMHILELDKYVIDIDDISSKKLIKKIDLMIKNRNDIKLHLYGKIKMIKKLTMEEIKKILLKDL